MSYTALYRKFRPDTFDAVKGQDHIVTTLKNQIKAGRIGHAYLFCGTRGTGKTTVSKLFAKAVNCERPMDGSPCGECSMCRAIQAQTSMNVIEIDAASNNGVDNIREIVEEVRYSPTEGNYKVYIIDEVHMLSAGAFNALLKTLEEPPSYIIFILATTEVHKIPVTILSRCQRYDFKRITVGDIVKRLEELMVQEGIEVEEKALRYVARAADGAMRDALSLMDQCISFYLGKKLTYDNVLEVLGTVDIEVFARLYRYTAKGDTGNCVSLLEELITAGRDLIQFTIDFTWYLRNLLILKTSGGMEELLEVSSDQMKLLQQESEAADAITLLRYIRIFSDLANQIKFASQKRVLVEVALIKLCHPEMEKDYSSLTERIRVLEEKLERGVIAAPAENDTEFYQSGDAETLIKKPEDEHRPLPEALPEDFKTIVSAWNTIISKTHPLVRTILISARPMPGTANQLLLLFENEVDKQVIDKEEHLKDIQDAIAAVIGKSVPVVTQLISSVESQTKAIPDYTKIFKNVPVNFVD